MEGRDRQWIPELCFGIDVQEEEGDRSPWSWDGNYRGLGVLGWAWRAEAWPGDPRALPPPQECRKEAQQLGRDLGLCPLLVSLARHASILSVPAVCHPPLGEAAAEDALLGALAGDTGVTPTFLSPEQRGDRSRVLRRGECIFASQEGNSLEALALAPKQAASEKTVLKC